MPETLEQPQVDYSTFQSTMHIDERHRIYAEAGALYDNGRRDEAFVLQRKIPLPPHMALNMLRDPLFGAAYLLDEGYNLADAAKCFGQDWMERYG